MTKTRTYRRPRKRNLVALLLSACATCISCVFGYYTPGTTATIGDFAPCPFKQDIRWQCVLEFPEFGYLGVNSQGHRGNQTLITVRLAPRKGVEVRWFGNEIILVDKANNIPAQRQKLDTKPVVGNGPKDRDDHLVLGYGRYIETRFDVRPLIDHMELRFPPVLVSGKQVEIPAIQLRERMRVPVVAPLFLLSK